jgi:hypothetical protein
MSKRNVLTLNRETIRQLDAVDLSRVAGGVSLLTCIASCVPISVLIVEAVVKYEASQHGLCGVAAG